MKDSKPFISKINEIEKRMDYVIESWESDEKITLQEIRLVLSAYLHGLYKNKRVKDIAKHYLHRIKEKKRLDFETILTALTAALVIGEDISEYWSKVKEKIDRSSGFDKSNSIIQLLIILTPNNLKKVKDEQYIRTLLENLKKGDTEKKLFSCWIEKTLFSKEEKIISQDEIKHLKEYLLWELVNSEDNEHQKEEIREKYISMMLDYKIERIDWIALLIYQFLKKNKPIIVTELELDRKIRHKIRSSISKKVWFPLVFSMIFVLAKLYLASAVNEETIGQIFILVLGTSLLFFEERLPSIEIPVKRYRVTLGQVGELLIIFSILWGTGLISLIFSFIW